MKVEIWRIGAITQVSTAAISFIGSSLTASMVARPSNGGLKTPYHRIVFGLSASDILQSLALLTGPWSMPPGIRLAPWGIGNEYTCRFNGAIISIGGCAVPMYVAGLCIYYFCKLTKRMSDATFQYKVERKIHAVIILSNVVKVAATFAVNGFHASALGSICSVTHEPAGCSLFPEVFGACIGNETGIFIVGVFHTLLIFLSMVITLTSMGMVLWHASVRERIFRPIADKSRTATNNNSETDEPSVRSERVSEPKVSEMTSEPTAQDIGKKQSVMGDVKPQVLPDPKESNPESDISFQQSVSEADRPTSDLPVSAGDNASAMQDYSSEGGPTPANDKLSSMLSYGSEESSSLKQTSNWSVLDVNTNNMPQHKKGLTMIEEQRIPTGDLDLEYLTKLYKREAVIQASCYAGSFFVCYFPFWLMIVLSFFRTRIVHLDLIWQLLYPIGGLFNIFAFLHPQSAFLRRRHPECSWFKAFWLVLKSGGKAPPAESFEDGDPKFSFSSRNSFDPSFALSGDAWMDDGSLPRSRNNISDPEHAPHYDVARENVQHFVNYQMKQTYDRYRSLQTGRTTPLEGIPEGRDEDRKDSVPQHDKVQHSSITGQEQNEIQEEQLEANNQGGGSTASSSAGLSSTLSSYLSTILEGSKEERSGQDSTITESNV